MAIDYQSEYHPLHASPVYVRISDPRFNDFRKGKEYRIIVSDEERGRRRSDHPSGNPVHDAVLVGVEHYEFGELPPYLVALVGCSSDWDEARKEVSAGDEIWEDDREVVALTFIRKDKVEEFVEEGFKPISHPFSKEDAEDK